MPKSCCRSRSRFRICAWIDTSSALTGSSQTISLGRSAMARAMPMRWRWPPENSFGIAVVVLGVEPDALHQLLDGLLDPAFGLDLLDLERAPR